MTNTEMLLGVLSVLTYFAGVQRGKRYRAEDQAQHNAERREERQRQLETERVERLRGVVDRYRELANRLESSNINGMLKAGVLGLQSGDEVREASRRITAEGLTPAIPPVYLGLLDGLDLLSFFRLISTRPDQARHDTGVKEIIQELRRSRGG